MKKVEEVESLKSSLQNKGFHCFFHSYFITFYLYLEKEFEVIAEKIASREQECAVERAKSQALQEVSFRFC